MVPDDWSRDLVTRTGFHFHVRPAMAADEAALGEFFTHVTPEDLRFRFLTGLRQVSHDRLIEMTTIDHRQTENFLAFENGKPDILATAMLACDKAMQTGEIAIAIRSDYKARGISWDLLAHVSDYAEAKGLTTIQSIESSANHAAIEMERQMGFVSAPYPGDATLVLVKRQLKPH